MAGVSVHDSLPSWFKGQWVKVLPVPDLSVEVWRNYSKMGEGKPKAALIGSDVQTSKYYLVT